MLADCVGFVFPIESDFRIRTPSLVSVLLYTRPAYIPLADDVDFSKVTSTSTAISSTYSVFPTVSSSTSARFAVEMSSMQTGLPHPWTVRFSKSKGLPYYYNPDTNESQWEPPANADATLLKEYMVKNYSSSGPPQGSAGVDKIRAAHLLVKHRESRRPSSWKEANISRTKDEAMAIILDFQQQIQSGQTTLGDLAVGESDCSSARKRGDLSVTAPDHIVARKF